MMQKRVYVGQFDKAGNMVQAGNMDVRQFQQNLKEFRNMRISRETYRAFHQKHQVIEPEKMAA